MKKARTERLKTMYISSSKITFYFNLKLMKYQPATSIKSTATRDNNIWVEKQVLNVSDRSVSSSSICVDRNRCVVDSSIFVRIPANKTKPEITL